MIETTQTVLVDADIHTAWAYARDIERWAEIMPGYQNCTIEGDDDSRWVLKVGVGGLVRTVRVKVHVDNWAGPGRVDFTYDVEGDPVQGGGTYLAASQGGQTEIALNVQVRGSGPMAPMWEAMGGPLLPKFARSFAEELKRGIEAAAQASGAAMPGAAVPASGPPPFSPLARLVAWLRSLLGGKPKGELS
jgi:carbon monoxide dehydrogenase subunit G